MRTWALWNDGWWLTNITKHPVKLKQGKLVFVAPFKTVGAVQGSHGNVSIAVLVNGKPVICNKRDLRGIKSLVASSLFEYYGVKKAQNATQ